MTVQNQAALFANFKCIPGYLRRHSSLIENRRVGALIALVFIAGVAFFEFATIPTLGQSKAMHGGGSYSSLIPVTDYLW